MRCCAATTALDGATPRASVTRPTRQLVRTADVHVAAGAPLSAFPNLLSALLQARGLGFDLLAAEASVSLAGARAAAAAAAAAHM